MSRNRVRSWDESSFTIQAGGRHAPIRPQAPKMPLVGIDKREFVQGYKYRRLSVRECARIQTFPDSFIFHYKNLADGYKMIGNAVPVKLAEHIATKILEDMKSAKSNVNGSMTQIAPAGILTGTVVRERMNRIINAE
jgi:DNA (cytosine-5)-methyltransferase 1